MRAAPIASAPTERLRDAAHALQTRGYVFLSDKVQLAPEQADWAHLVRHWDDLPLDAHMGDGGRYRRRRFGAFWARGRHLERLPPRPHRQETHFNPLNGGYDRWFAPISADFAGAEIFEAIVRLVIDVIEWVEATTEPAWDIEVHQFRIEATTDQAGLPAPEGPHREGRRWVFVMVVGRTNVEGGETRLHSDEGAILEARTLMPGDGVPIDDRRLLHGATAIHPRCRDGAGWRDALVLTFEDRSGTTPEAADARPLRSGAP